MVDRSLSLKDSLTYCQAGRAAAGLQTGRAIVFISLRLNTALGETRGKVGEEGRPTILGGSVATRQCVYHNSCRPQGKLGRLHQRPIHSPPLPSDAHTHTHTVRGTCYLPIWCVLKYIFLKKVKGSCVPACITEAVGSQRCGLFTIVLFFCVNELKFHLSGAPCICQHILRIESGAGLASTHLSHRLLLIGSSPYNSSPQDMKGERGGERERGRERKPMRVFLCTIF